MYEVSKNTSFIKIVLWLEKMADMRDLCPNDKSSVQVISSTTTCISEQANKTDKLSPLHRGQK